MLMPCNVKNFLSLSTVMQQSVTFAVSPRVCSLSISQWRYCTICTYACAYMCIYTYLPLCADEWLDASQPLLPTSRLLPRFIKRHHHYQLQLSPALLLLCLRVCALLDWSKCFSLGSSEHRFLGSAAHYSNPIRADTIHCRAQSAQRVNDKRNHQQ